MAPDTPGTSALYQPGPDGALTELLGGVTLSNGIDWNPGDDLMYYVDTTTERIDLFDYDIATGAIANRRVFAGGRVHPVRR